MDIFKQLHTSIAKSLERSFDNAYKDLNAELVRRDGRSKEAEEAAKAAEEANGGAAVRIQELEREIADLKEQLHPCEVDANSKKFSTSMQETYGPEHVLECFDGSGMDALDPDVKAQITDIGAKYRGLYKNFQELIGVCGTLRIKVDSHKRKLVQWQDRITREEFAIEISGTPTKFQRVHGAPRTRDQLRKHTPLEPLKPVSQRARTGASTGDLNQPKPTLAEEPQGQGTRNGYGAGNVPRPSFTTEPPDSASTESDDPSLECQETASNDHTSDTSTGTTIRESKRKRMPLPEPGPLTNGRLERPILIKSEGRSSSPSRHFSEDCAPIGTQDLDEIGSSVETPTKKNRYNPGPYNKKGSSASNLFEAASELEQDYGTSQRPMSERRASKGPKVLQPIDGNSRSASLPDQRSTKPRRSLGKESRHAIPSITEDGESYGDAGTTKRIGKQTPGINMERPLPSTNNASVQQRLQDLLEGPLPSRLPLNAQRSLANTSSDCASGLDDAMGQSSTSHIRDVSAANSKKVQEMQEPGMQPRVAHTEKSPSVDTRTNPTEVRPKDGPYRTRPLHQLELSHFKINPDYNQGLDFAFDTVVRNRDERKCVTGCTRPGCCGDAFLSMARVGGLPSDIGEERKILEEYLGADKHLLDIMDPQDRTGLLHEAQARRIADAYGKHRHSHPRPRTPPGFWRTDMPDTQELEHDREEARKLEREKVYERYREARRPGALWKFEDE